MSEETDPKASLDRLLVSVRYLAAMLGLLIAAVVSFHPWVVAMVERALQVLPLLLLVLIFVYVVNPMVEFVLRQVRKVRQLERFSYEKSLVFTYLLLLAVVGSVLAVLLPKLAHEVHTLAVNLPSFAVKIQDVLEVYRDRYFEALPENVQQQVTKGVGEIGATASRLIQSGLVYVGAFSQALFWTLGALIFVPLIGFYMLKDGDEMMGFLVGLAPEEHQPHYRRILGQIHVAMQNFLKGQVILCLVIGVITTVAMAFVLPQYCIALGLVAGITEAIPVIGPFLGAIPSVIIAFAIPGGGPGLALLVIGLYAVIQQLENVVLVPRVMGESLGLHPLSLILGMMVFGNIFGFWGVVLAAPIVATVKILVLHTVGKGAAAGSAGSGGSGGAAGSAGSGGSGGSGGSAVSAGSAGQSAAGSAGSAAGRPAPASAASGKGGASKRRRSR